MNKNIAQEVAFLYAAGYEKKEISIRLNIDIDEVNSILENVFCKTGCKNGREFSLFVLQKFSEFVNI